MTSVTDLMRLHTHLGAQWVAGLTRNVEVVSSSTNNAPLISLSKKLPLLLSTGWFQERIPA